MHKLSRILSLVILTALLVFTTVSLPKKAEAEDTQETLIAEMTDVITAYYHNGKYYKYTTINLLNNVRYRKTVYDGLNLFMMNSDGSTSSINSGYVSEEAGDLVTLYHYQKDTSGNIINRVSCGNLGDINHYFVTLTTFTSSYLAQGTWTKSVVSNGLMSLKDTEYICSSPTQEMKEDWLHMCAPCFSNSDNTFVFTKVGIIIRDDYTGYHLWFVLYDTRDYSLLEGGTSKFAIAQFDYNLV